MISDETRKKYADDSGNEITRRLLEAFDEAETNQDTDPIQAILDEALTILKEKIDEAADN